MAIVLTPGFRHWFRWIGSEKAFWTRDTGICYLAEAVNFSGKKGWMFDSCVQTMLIERLLHNLTAHITRGFYQPNQRNQCHALLNHILMWRNPLRLLE